MLYISPKLMLDKPSATCGWSIVMIGLRYMNQIKSSVKSAIVAPKILQDILGELRLLRLELTILLPHEDVVDFAHPRRIRRSYENAVKQYPPAPLWK